MDSVDEERWLDRERRLGRRIQAERLQRGISQERLAEALGISFQQVQRYESGTTPMTATRLQVVAGLLGSSVGDLLAPPPSNCRDAEGAAALAGEVSELVRLWPDVPADVRTCFLALARAVVDRT